MEQGPLGGVTGILEKRSENLVLVFSIKLIRQSIALRVNANTPGLVSSLIPA
jgi:hypothetical protein